MNDINLIDAGMGLESLSWVGLFGCCAISEIDFYRSQEWSEKNYWSFFSGRIHEEKNSIR